MRIVSRAEWGARYDDGAGPAPLPAVEGLCLHHSTTRARNGGDAVLDLEQIGEDRFGAGISYTFAVTPDGTVYQGHSVNRLGAHTKGHNSTIRAVCLIGNYDQARPSAAAMDSVAELLAHGVSEGWWPLILTGHRDWRSTACPGAAAYGLIPATVEQARRLLIDPSTPTPTPDPEDIMATTDELRALIREELSGIARNTLTELAQTGSVLIRDDRKEGSQVWVTNGITRRPVADRAEAQALEKVLGLPKAYPAYPTVPWALVKRLPVVVAA